MVRERVNLLKICAKVNQNSLIQLWCFTCVKVGLYRGDLKFATQISPLLNLNLSEGWVGQWKVGG